MIQRGGRNSELTDPKTGGTGCPRLNFTQGPQTRPGNPVEGDFPRAIPSRHFNDVVA